MELKGESLIAAPRAAVWAALNDPDVLARCIDGVESLTSTVDATGATRFDGKMNARVGPVRATFAGGVTLTEVDEPNRYVLIGEGKGGVAGFAKGSAEVTLADADVGGRPGTRLDYAVASSVGGKLAQLGARLIEGTARGYAETFFTRFKAELEAPASTTASTDSAAPAPRQETTPSHGESAREIETTRAAISPIVWGSVIVLIVLVVLFWQLQ